jgi:hypothetical protein
LFFPCICRFIVVASCDATIKNDCPVLDVVVVALQSILSLAPCTFAIINVVDLHQSKRLVVAYAILGALLLQATIIIAPCDMTEFFLSSLLLLAI